MKKVHLTAMLMISGLVIFYSFRESAQTEQGMDYGEPVGIERGAYLVEIVGCAHCHTPKKMTDQGPVYDMDRWMSGYPAGNPLPAIDKSEITPGKWALFHGDLTAAVGPWGITYAANLTPHETGIGNWTYDHFKRAMTDGKFKGMENGRILLPPMPWQSYTQMQEEDLRAIFAYLKSIKPVDNKVPAHKPVSEI